MKTELKPNVTFLCHLNIFIIIKVVVIIITSIITIIIAIIIVRWRWEWCGAWLALQLYPSYLPPYGEKCSQQIFGDIFEKNIFQIYIYMIRKVHICLHLVRSVDDFFVRWYSVYTILTVPTSMEIYMNNMHWFCENLFMRKWNIIHTFVATFLWDKCRICPWRNDERNPTKQTYLSYLPQTKQFDEKYISM